ncbi:hypothetical protein BH23PLA1_BH23PLA1_01660 [soil metagenome]
MMIATAQDRIQASRENGRKSRGPCTAEGKANSRANALVHGLRAEILVPDSEKFALDARLAKLDIELSPVGEVEQKFVHRVGLAFLKLDRCERAEQSALETNAQKAVADWEKAQRHAVRRRAQDLRHDPAEIADDLRSCGFGIDWMLRRWNQLRHDLIAGRAWSADQLDHALRLLGTDPEVAEIAWADAPGAAILRREAESLISGDEPPESCRSAMLAVVEDEIAQLEAERPTAFAAVEAPRKAEILSIALIDISDEGQRRARYERDAETSMHRNLNGLSRRQKERQAKIEARRRAVYLREMQPQPAPNPAPIAPPRPMIDLRPSPVEFVNVSATGAGAPEPNEPEPPLPKTGLNERNPQYMKRIEQMIGLPAGTLTPRTETTQDDLDDDNLDDDDEDDNGSDW